MKKQPDDPEILEEYDFSEAVRGKYHRRFAAGSNVVVLDADVADVFPNSEAVNQTLRAIGGIIRRHSRKSQGGQPPTGRPPAED